MNTNRLSLIVLAITLLLPLPSQAIAPGESLVLDPNTGDYLITYMGDGGDEAPRLQQVRFVPSTKIDPTVKSSFKINKDGAIAYGYKITNGVKSRQPLVSMAFDPVSAIKASRPLPRTWEELDRKLVREIGIAGQDALSKPTGWDGYTHPSDVGGHRISWIYGKLDTDNDGLQPGQSQGGFGFVSPDLPGMGIAETSGNAPDSGFPDEGPDGEIGDLFDQLQINDFVPRNAAVPAIAVPNPFDPAVLLERIQTHVHTWIARKLLDPAFSAQLDRFFLAAATAYRSNQPEAARKPLQAMRESIHQEHTDSDKEDEKDDKTDDHEKKKTQRVLIDKLAARILDFDLKYVMKRMDGDDKQK